MMFSIISLVAIIVSIYAININRRSKQILDEVERGLSTSTAREEVPY